MSVKQEVSNKDTDCMTVILPLSLVKNKECDGKLFGRLENNDYICNSDNDLKSITK